MPSIFHRRPIAKQATSIVTHNYRPIRQSGMGVRLTGRRRVNRIVSSRPAPERGQELAGLGWTPTWNKTTTAPNRVPSTSVPPRPTVNPDGTLAKTGSTTSNDGFDWSSFASNLNTAVTPIAATTVQFLSEREQARINAEQARIDEAAARQRAAMAQQEGAWAQQGPTTMPSWVLPAAIVGGIGLLGITLLATRK